jgi:hypothetical protein
MSKLSPTLEIVLHDFYTRSQADLRQLIKDYQDSRFIWKHSDTYTSVTRGHFLNNIYIQDMTEWTYDEK